jgi:hypothetical protein
MEASSYEQVSPNYERGTEIKIPCATFVNKYQNKNYAADSRHNSVANECRAFP